jgi:hypothetical protein
MLIKDRYLLNIEKATPSALLLFILLGDGIKQIKYYMLGGIKMKK